MKVYIFADGGGAIGMGHISRTLPLARCLKERGHSVVYAGSMAAGLQKAADEGFGTFFLDGEKYSDSLSELPDVCIIDRYDVTGKFFADIRRICRYLVYIDDLSLFDYPVDMLVNGTASAVPERYENQSAASTKLLGLQYNLVDGRFCFGAGRSYRQAAKRILVTMGGTDALNSTGMLLGLMQKAKASSEISIDVVVGRNCPHADALNERYAEDKQVCFHTNIDDLKPLMCQCDFAISAGGITLYELMAAGVPSVSVITASNQKPQSDMLHQQDILLSMGNIENITVNDINLLEESILSDYMLWTNRAQRACRIIDGKGAARIADEIERAMKA